MFRLVQAEKPALPRNRYSEEQITRALARMDTALADWGWAKRDDVIKLFLANQMIARRMGFSELNRLFNGPYSSTRAEEAFEAGERFPTQPLTTIIYLLVAARAAGDSRTIVDILRRNSPAFSVNGINANNTLKAMVDTSLSLVEQLNALWESGSIGELLRFCATKQIIPASDKLSEQLNRARREEHYVEELHALDKGDWLADALFAMKPDEIAAYASFIAKNTAYSTQHGVKGEEYSKVQVVYDDAEDCLESLQFRQGVDSSDCGRAHRQPAGPGAAAGLRVLLARAGGFASSALHCKSGCSPAGADQPYVALRRSNRDCDGLAPEGQSLQTCHGERQLRSLDGLALQPGPRRASRGRRPLARGVDRN